MKRTPLVESSAEPIQLSRKDLPELLKTLEEDGHVPSITWNAVDALELLVEAGHFRAARALADGVRSLVAGSPRERLFRGYISLCDLMDCGRISECAQEIEAMQAEIAAGGHSAADRARAALLLARALFVGVSLGVLPDEDLLRARAALAVEFEACATQDARKYRFQLGLELSKTYLHAPRPELLQAQLLVDKLEAYAASEQCFPQSMLELRRVQYHVKQLGCSVEESEAAAEELRREARSAGELEEALVEIAIARCSAGNSDGTDRLQHALMVFEKNRFNSGTIEALFVVADAALSRGLTTRASALFSRIIELAHDGGHLQAALIAIYGSFHVAISDGNLDAARDIRKTLEASLDSDLAIGAVGFSAVHAAQVLGDSKSAARCASICERLYKARGVRAAQAQALYLAGSAHAAAGEWQRAKKAWKESLEIEESRRAVVSSSDKRAALAQAVTMSEFSRRGYVSERAIREAGRLLMESEEALAPFGAVPAALRALAKALSIRAQLSVVSKDPVSAVSCLHRARGLYEKLGSTRDVALTDALSGLALLEVGKTRGGEIFEEAHAMLRQALTFFDSPQHNVIRWKLKYYLSMSAYLSSQAKGHGQGGLSWRETSASWLRGAMVDLESASSQDCAGSDAADFSPGLTPEVLEPLKRALGLKERTKQRPSASIREPEKAPGDGGYLH